VISCLLFYSSQDGILTCIKNQAEGDDEGFVEISKNLLFEKINIFFAFYVF